jgi:hypothetical protein
MIAPYGSHVEWLTLENNKLQRQRDDLGRSIEIYLAEITELRQQCELLRATLEPFTDIHWRDNELSKIGTERDNMQAQRDALLAACDRLGTWMAAALDDPNVCDAMKVDINAWFAAIKLTESKS